MRTSVVEDNLNPIFMETKDVAIDFNDSDTYVDAPPCIMDIMDADEGYISDSADFLGRCLIHLKDIKDKVSQEPQTIPLPQWFDVRFGTDPSSPTCGQILCSFGLYPGDDDKKTPPPVEIMPRRMDEMVEKLEFDVKINCLGLRNLESMGLIPIQKAFVSFMVKSLTDPKKSGTLANLYTAPMQSGPNPNINNVIKFSLPLPVDELYCPSVSCTVYDQVFLGLSQPVVGTFTIPFGRIMQECWREREDVLSRARELLDKLDKRIEGRLADPALIMLEEAKEDSSEEEDMVEVEDDEMKLIRESREREEAKQKIEEEKAESGHKKSKLAPKKGGKALQAEAAKNAASILAMAKDER